MALYKIELLPPVIKKDLPKLPSKDAARVMDRIAGLADNPRPAWSKKLSARPEYRARQGQYRVLYVVDEQAKTVTITAARHRKDIYR